MKPIQEMTEDEKDEAIRSARYILEEFFEDGRNRIRKASKYLGYPEGVIHSAFENIFGERIVLADPKGSWVFERSSGYAGYRCQKCATWIYDSANKTCKCDD